MKHGIRAAGLFLATTLIAGLTGCEPQLAKMSEKRTLAAGNIAINADDKDAYESSKSESSDYENLTAKSSKSKDKLSGPELVAALKEGGHVIYLRHAKTEKDYTNQAKDDVNDCSTQKVLSEAGWVQSLEIGKVFEATDIPVGKVVSSEYCRAWQTAQIAFGKYEKNSNFNFLPFEDYTDEQVAKMKASLTPLLVEVLESDTNTVIVGHEDLFEAAAGIYPEPQGIAHVLKPDGTGFQIVANVLSDEWTALAN